VSVSTTAKYDDLPPGEREAAEFADAVIEYVPRKGRMLIWTIQLYALLDDERLQTVADVAEEAGLSENVARQRLTDLLDLGLVSWDADGMRVTLPGVSWGAVS